MGESSGWRVPKFAIFLVILAVHLALVALLVMKSRTLPAGAASERPIEVMLLPHTKVPRVRAENTRPQLKTDLAIALSPTLLNSSTDSGPGAAHDGRGSPVNWTAEAHRAVRAYEIRRDQPPSAAAAVSSPWDGWWPRRGHHAGDRYKTDSGDWIVWIDANCYQIASWHAGAIAANTNPPRTICPAENGWTDGDKLQADD
jgi:hypothetical protein